VAIIGMSFVFVSVRRVWLWQCALGVSADVGDSLREEALSTSRRVSPTSSP
jgi:hypothetical protein